MMNQPYLQVMFVFTFVLCSTGQGRAAETELAFETDVHPILKAHCFQCHGELGEREGELDLRLTRLISTGGESGAAIVAGKPDESLLLERVRSGEMPPGDKTLSDEEIATIAKWIKQGAKTAEPEPEEIGDGPIFTKAERNYWAFQAVQRPTVPASNNARARTEVDQFILTEGPSVNSSIPHPGFADDADREKLLRRAAFDLTGLPPSLELLDRVLKNPSPNWWETAIDELLASPHYGERWGRHWLDIAGYADSEGYTDDDRVRLHAWRYRDYVIQSINADKPFDEFVVEQLAGDELVGGPNNNLNAEQIQKLTATGFLRMAPDGTASGGINKTEARNQVIADTVQIVGTSLLGMTVQCAQCHDHRYDPISQADYYRLRAVFEPAYNPKKWKTPPQRRISLYTDADRDAAKKIEAQAVKIDQERKVKGDEYITFTLEEELELAPEEKRDLLRTAYRTAAKERTDEQKALLKEYPRVASISVGSLYLFDNRRGQRARELDAKVKKNEKQYLLQTAASELTKVPELERSAVETAMKVKPESRSDEQKELLTKYPGVLVTLQTLAQFNPSQAEELERDRKTVIRWRQLKTADDLKEYAEKAKAVRAKKPKEGFLRALYETAGNVPETFVFHRGDPEQPKEQVEPGDLSIIDGRPEIASNDPAVPSSGRRLAFAKQLTDGTHPLLARVIVNRIWLHHFGRGLVETPADFGVLGSTPTHPQLLDWLAAEFVDSGWSMKHMHRVLMHSTVYRQSGIATAKAESIDPDNQLYSRYPIQRLESEALRDAMLAVSGKLNTKAFGPPIPVMEDSVGQVVLGKENLDGERKPVDKVDLKGEEYRRSIYIQVRRTRTFSMFETFDAPAMSPNCEIRNASTVAPQSLFFMNSNAVIDFSGFFADRLIKEAPDDLSKQVTLAWRLAFSRTPSDKERDSATAFVEKQSQLVHEKNDKWDDAKVKREALAIYAQALLSSNRFLYVD